MSKMIKCAICGEECHFIASHLEENHPEMSIEEYQRRFPDSPIMSKTAKKALDDKHKSEDSKKHPPLPEGKAYFHDVFELGQEGMSATGQPIPITIVDGESKDLVPEINHSYVFSPTELKWVMSGVEINVPIYVWGHKGSGKTELIEQICARTHRPLIRVQHTLNTEESSIIGQWVVRNGETVFEYGALALAMLNGWAYLADEYDFALPNVLSVYQAVLEGKPLFIKEAPADMRVIKPHPDFRFFATGNTNGVGDETGLYQGTSTQNAANYDRFAVVIHKDYLPPQAEIEILLQKTGISKSYAQLLISFAGNVRKAFDNKNISDTISPRTLLFAAKLGMMHGNFKTGLTLAFLNKLNSVDRAVCLELAQRIFGYDE